MKAITATVSFTIKNRFYKEDLDEQLESYKEEIEALLDYDCDVYEPIKEEEVPMEENTDEEQSTIEESPKYVTADKRSIGYDYVYSWNGLAQG